MGWSESLNAIISPRKHKLRRAMISPVFSKQALDGLIPIIYRHASSMSEIMDRKSALGESINIQRLYRCITVSYAL